MNQQAYRVIFNHQRGQSMVVAETVSAGANSSRGECARSGNSGGNKVAGISPLSRLSSLSIHIAALFGGLLLLSLVNLVPQAQAQILSDPQAGARSPVIDNTANGRPLIQIATPNDAGVSHNQYNQFNVDPQGVILNNARQDTATQLGGYVSGNPNLTNGSAGIILNEVTGPGRSMLRGYTEVAGQRAEVILANPNGISCAGCGFLNTSRATLTTGVPEFGSSGNLNAFRVTRGDIQINGAGLLNDNNVNQLDLISRSIQVNGELWAKDLNLITGANRVDYSGLGVQVISGEGARPTVSIDVAQLGGMYANKIRLIGTESGVGVASLGTVAASTGDILIDSAGKLTLNGRTDAKEGRITLRSNGELNHGGNLHARQAIQIDSTGDLHNSGTISGEQDIRLHSTGQLSNSKTIKAGGNLIVEADRIDSSGILGAGIAANGEATQNGDLQLTATRDLRATGSHSVGGNLSMSGTSLVLANAHSAVAGSVNLNARNGDIDHHAAQLHAGKDITLNASGQIDNREGRIENNGQNTTLTLTTSSLDNRDGRLVNRSTGATQINSSTQIANDGGILGGKGDVTLTSRTLSNTRQAKVGAGGTLTLTHSERIDNTDGTLLSGADLHLDTATLNGDGQISVGRDASLALRSDYTQTAANRLDVHRNLTLTTSGDLTNAGTLSAVGDLTLKARALRNQNGALINAGDGNTRIRLNGGLDNLGRIYGNDVAISAQTILNDGERHPDGSTKQAGVIAARNQLDLGAAIITNREHGLIQSIGDMAIGRRINDQHQMEGSADQIDNRSATIDAGGNLALQTARLNNTNEHFETAIEIDPGKTRRITRYRLDGNPTEYDETEISRLNNGQVGRVRVNATGQENEDFTRITYLETTRRSVVKQSDPARILAGGNLQLSGAVTNDNSSIVAGGTLSGSTADLANVTTPGQRVVHRGGDGEGSNSQHHTTEKCGGGRRRCDDWGSKVIIDDDLPTVTFNLSVAEFKEKTAAAHDTNAAVGTPVRPDTALQSAFGTTITPVTSSLNYTTSQTLTGPNPLPHLTLPTSQLYQIQPAPGQRYLIETDPQFTQYKRYLSSDYLMQRLVLDPQRVHKRLGDGFYEQKLLNDQILQLTGRRFLHGQNNNEQQYQALMDQGLAVAAQLELSPGIALTPAQLAALTADIVWLVEQDITLTDGTQQRVLAPVVYLARAKAADLPPTGALIAADNINLKVHGTLNNGGTLQANQQLQTTATDILNSGTIRSTGKNGSVVLIAQNDLLNRGGELSGQRIAILAGRDIVLDSPTSHSSVVAARAKRHDVFGQEIESEDGGYTKGFSSDHTAIARTSTLTAGDLHLQSGRDLTANAVQITSTGNTTLIAGRDLNLNAVTTKDAVNIDYDEKNHLRESQTQVNGTQIAAQGQVRLIAGQDLKTTAATVTADQRLTAAAGRDITLTTARQDSLYDQEIYTTESTLVSSSSTHIQDQQKSSQAIGSTLSADSVQVSAGRDVTLSGSNLVATKNLSARAGNNLALDAAQNTASQTYNKTET
ncbi:filamentous hemagglutinin N-terminal domain-containing protein, partial [Herbaspirillum sp. RTI4]